MTRTDTIIYYHNQLNRNIDSISYMFSTSLVIVKDDILHNIPMI